MSFPKILTTKKTGHEKFSLNEKELGFDVASFWAWSSSELLGNALRGVLAEYIISKSINCKEQLREEWDAFDLISPEGITIEVKSSSYLQSWAQSKLSIISFGIQPTTALDPSTNKYSKVRKRQADVYIFCVYAHKCQETANPLNIEHWEFYVIPTSVLNENCKQQKSISLARLLTLNPLMPSYNEIHSAVIKCKSA